MMVNLLRDRAITKKHFKHIHSAKVNLCYNKPLSSVKYKPGFSLKIYFQALHNTIGSYETPSSTHCYLNVRWEARLVVVVGVIEVPNGAAIN